MCIVKARQEDDERRKRLLEKQKQQEDHEREAEEEECIRIQCEAEEEERIRIQWILYRDPRLLAPAAKLERVNGPPEHGLRHELPARRGQGPGPRKNIMPPMAPRARVEG